MINTVRRCFCIMRAASHVIMAVLRVTVMFTYCGVMSRRRQVAGWSQKALAIFGLNLVTTRNLAPEGNGGCLLVANHVSWLDVLAIWARTDVVFVAKSEVGDWPLIGALARRLGVIFIDRSRRKDAMSTGRAISNILANGRSVCIFPEGTTTEGRELQRFQTALFQPAIDVGAAVQPLVIRYFRADGTRAAEAAFTGEMSLLQSMWHLAGADPITIDLSFLLPINPSGQDRRTLARRAQELIGQRLRDPAPVFASTSDVGASLQLMGQPIHSTEMPS